MKRFIISFLFSTLLFGNISLANNGKIPETVLSLFKMRFQDAQTISWTDSKDYYKVAFSSNGQSYCAFYSHEGNFVALSRQIVITQLPLLLQHNLQKRYGKYTISSVVELEQDDAISYYADMENEKTNLIVRCGLSGEWTEFLKTKKK